jgi:hypothetical protein
MPVVVSLCLCRVRPRRVSHLPLGARHGGTLPHGHHDHPSKLGRAARTVIARASSSGVFVLGPPTGPGDRPVGRREVRHSEVGEAAEGENARAVWVDGHRCRRRVVVRSDPGGIYDEGGTVCRTAQVACEIVNGIGEIFLRRPDQLGGPGQAGRTTSLPSARRWCQRRGASCA